MNTKVAGVLVRLLDELPLWFVIFSIGISFGGIAVITKWISSPVEMVYDSNAPALEMEVKQEGPW